MVQIGNTIKIQYINSNVVQNKRLISKELSDMITSNKNHIMALHKSKDKNNIKQIDEEIKLFEKNNICKFDFNMVVINSPFYLAVIEKNVGDVGQMTLPETQGGLHEIKILEIYE
jgi:uncharacterized membrane protein (DUF106 family)